LFLFLKSSIELGDEKDCTGSFLGGFFIGSIFFGGRKD